MKNITTISLPPDLKAVAKRNGSHRGIKALSTYIQYLIQQDDHLIQDAKISLIGGEWTNKEAAKIPIDGMGINEIHIIQSAALNQNVNFIYKTDAGTYNGYQTAVDLKGHELVWQRGQA
jgi:hypothetical protein